MQKLITTLLFVLLLSGCSVSETTNKKISPVVSRETFTLASEIFQPKLFLTGTLEATQETVVAAKAPGRVEVLYVDVGDTVAAEQLLGELVGNEFAVSLDIARTSEMNMRSIYNSQKELLKTQIESARKMVTIVEANLQATQQGKTDTQHTTEEQIKLAERGVSIIETALENANNIATQRLDSLYESAPSTINSALVVVSGAHTFFEKLLDVDNRGNCDSCRDYDTFLGAHSTQTKITAKDKLKISSTRLEQFIVFYNESFADDTLNREEWDIYMTQLLELLQVTQQTALAINFMLDNTVTGSNLSEDVLLQLKSESLQHGQNVEQAVISMSATVKVGVKGWMLTRDEILIQNTVEISGTEKQLLLAKQELEQVKAGSSQGISAASSQVSVLEKQVEQAYIALAAAEAQQESALRELEQNIELASGNRRLSEVAIENTKIIAPFSGVITSKLAEEGQVLAPGQPVFQIFNSNLLKIKTDVPDTKINKLQLGLKANVSIDGLVGIYPATLTKIDPSVNPVTRKLNIELTLSEIPPVVWVGQFAHIDLYLPEEQAYFVPRKFIKTDFDGQYVKLANGSKQIVLTGIDIEDKTKIWWLGEMESVTIIN